MIIWYCVHKQSVAYSTVAKTTPDPAGTGGWNNVEIYLGTT